MFKIYHQDIRPGEVYDAVIDDRKIGKSVVIGAFSGKKRLGVLFREKQDIVSYRFHDYVVNESGLVLRDAIRHDMSQQGRNIADRILIGKGL